MSLAIVQPHRNLRDIEDSSSREYYDDGTSITRSRLWLFDGLTHPNTSISRIEPPLGPYSFDTLLSIDFGGPGGILLASLTRLVVHMDSEIAPIVGFEFFYGDRRTQFGSDRGIEMSALIDGPGGERIIDVKTAAPNAGPTKLSLQAGFSLKICCQ